MFGSTNTKLWSSGPSYGYIMAEYPEGSQCQITRELDEKILKARGTGDNWAFALPEVIGLKVPKEYQEVEYIQSSGTQWINPDVNASDIHKLIFDFAITARSQYPMVYAAYYGGNNVFQLADSAGNGTMGFASGSVSAQFDGYTVGTRYRAEIDIDSGIAKMGDVSKTFSAGTTPPSVIPYFFARHDSDTVRHMTSMRLYYAEIVGSNSTILREFIPCYRKSDNVAGLWDTVGKTFYTNAGTGVFVVGPATGDEWTVYCTDGENEAEKKVNILYNGDIKSTVLDYRIPIEYQAIEYLQNSTAAYYDTGIIPTTTNYTTELKFQVAQTNGGYLLGVEGGYRLRKPDGYSQIYYAYIDSETYFTVDGISTVGTDFDLIYNATGGQIILNGAVKATNANIRAKSDRQYSILIGASRYGANVQNYGVWRYKEVIISERDTGNKLAELFPCYRKSDNVVGFWDTVGQKFLTHLGTGTVVAGPDI